MDKGINLHKELAMGLPGAKAEAQGKKVKQQKMPVSTSKTNMKKRGKVKSK